MIECLPLADFDATNWEQIETVFANMKTLEFKQFWLSQLETDFAPAKVRLGWRADALWVFATLHDIDIHSESTADGQPMWQLGDVFEIFARVLPGKPWYEFHVTPNHHHLELRWPDDPEICQKQVKQKGYEAFIISEPIIKSRVHLCKEQGYWQVLVEIPATLISGGNPIAAGQNWLVAFCRYDTFRDQRKPVLSSTADFTKAAFHRQQEWNKLTFVK